MGQTIEDIKALIEKDYRQKVRYFMTLDPSHKGIIIGDSMVAYLNLRKYGLDVEWINMGIAGDTTIGVLNRLDPVTRLKPKKVILSIGSNDIVLTDLSSEQTVENILSIKKTIESHTDATVYVMSMTPVLRDHPISHPIYIGKRTNHDLLTINRMLQDQLPDGHFIPVFESLCDSEGNLDEKYTTDGIHLNHTGYLIYVSKIKSLSLCVNQAYR